MNGTKTILVCAGALLATGAQGADPVFEDVTAAREPVFRCDITGFVELPGTDICFKVGGFARLAVTAASDTWVGPAWRVGNIRPWTKTQQDRFQMFTEGRLSFDARTMTEYGAVRGYVELQATDDKGRSGGPLALRHAYVQFGNWTFGKTWSTFLHRASNTPAPAAHDRLGENSMRRNQIRYTQPIGGGFSASFAIEDAAYNYGQVGGTSPTALPGVDSSGKVISVEGLEAPAQPAYKDRGYVPDLVASLQLSGDWGSAQISGAAHQNRVRSGPSGVGLGATDRKWGWAALFGLSLNMPTGEGDSLGFKAVYTDGASQYHQDLYPGSVNLTWGRPLGAPGASDGILSAVQTWSVLGYFEHFWTPSLSTAIGAGYAEIDYRRAGTAVTPGTTANPTGTAGKRLLEVFGTAEWTPVPRLSFLVNVSYGHADWRNQVTPGLPEDLSKAKGGAWVSTLQVTRSF